MRQEIHASVRIELLEDPRQSAQILATFATAWGELLDKLGIEIEASVSLSEVRARGVGRPRKPRLVPPSEQAA